MNRPTLSPRGVVAAVVLAVGHGVVSAQGFEKISTTVMSIQALLVTVSVAVVTIAIISAGFKMIFEGARLA